MASALSERGERAKAPASIRGRSGVRHQFVFALLRDSGEPKLVVDMERSDGEVDDVGVLRFYVKAFDVNPEKAVLCVSPRLTTRAAALARAYGIVVIEAESPPDLVLMAGRFVDESFGAPGR